MVTKRQKQLLDYLRTYIEQHGYAPTLEEIGKHFSLSSLATVHKHLQNLERKGRIRRLHHHSRAMEVVPEPRFGRAVEVPLLGRVAAGVPIEAVEEPETISLPEEMLGRGETFALRVRPSASHSAASSRKEATPRQESPGRPPSRPPVDN